MIGRRIAGALVAYVLMGGVALGLGLWQGRLPTLAHPAPALALGAWSSAASLGAGLAIALVTILSTRWLLVRTRWARALRRELRMLLVGASGAQLLLLGVSSGVAEELLFRGAIQPIAGLFLTSLGFGLLHVGPRRELLPWTAWAIVMGFVLGALYEATGTLAGPILAHVLINTVNLRVIVLHDARLDRDDGRLAPPKLVARVRRE